jgi:hypothetical protein
MNRIHSLFQVALLLLLVVGCGAEFQGTAGDGGEAGSGEPRAGAPSSGSGGASGSGGSAGDTPRGGAAGSGGSAGSGTAGAAGAGGIAEPSCSPADAVLELAGMTLTLEEHEWTDGSHCASCPPGGCTTCTVESAHVDAYWAEFTPMAALAAVLRCDSAILAGTCDGEKTLCIEQSARAERIGESTFSVHMDFEPKGDGYELSVAGTASSTEGSFICGDYGYSFRSKIASLFEEMVDHSFLRCN